MRTTATGACISSRFASSSWPNFPLQKIEPPHGVGRRARRITEHEAEAAFGELAHGRDGYRHPEVALRRQHDERLALGCVHLAAQHVEVLRGSGRIDDAEIVLGAHLEEALEPRGGVLGALAFPAVGEQQHQSAGLAPLVFGRDDELVDDDLPAVHEVAELRFPHDESVAVGNRVAVLEPEGGELREHGVVDHERRL